jgi:hypothetical protein
VDDDRPGIQLTVIPRQIEPHVLRQKTHEEVTRLRSLAMLITAALLRPDARYEVYVSTQDEDEEQSTGDTTQESPSAGSLGACVDRYSPLARVLQYRLPSIDLPTENTSYLSDRDVQRLAWGVEQVRKMQSTTPCRCIPVERCIHVPKART